MSERHCGKFARLSDEPGGCPDCENARDDLVEVECPECAMDVYYCPMCETLRGEGALGKVYECVECGETFGPGEGE